MHVEAVLSVAALQHGARLGLVTLYQRQRLASAGGFRLLVAFGVGRVQLAGEIVRQQRPVAEVARFAGQDVLGLDAYLPLTCVH